MNTYLVNIVVTRVIQVVTDAGSEENQGLEGTHSLRQSYL